MQPLKNDKQNEEKNKQQKATSLKNPISRLAYTMAKITLRFNLMFNEFFEMYKFHLANLARKQNPEASIVELSARTGLDRRYITETLRDEELKKTSSKVQLVLKELRQLCKKNNSNLVVKCGKTNSFKSICNQISSGSLTNKAIANELLRLGEIIDKDRKFEVVNITPITIEDSLDYYYLARRVSNEITAICLHNNTKYIAKKGKVNSLESIAKFFDIDVITFKRILNYLSQVGNIKEESNSYLLIVKTFFNLSDKYSFNYLTTNINRIISTIIENIDNLDKNDRRLQRNIYSNQIHPRNFKKLNKNFKRIFEEIENNIYKIFMSFEEDVPRKTYPTNGISIYTFESNQNLDY